MKTSKTGLIEKSIFIQSSSTLLVAFAELGSRMLMDIMLRKNIEEVIGLPEDSKNVLKSHGAAGIAKMTSDGFKILTSHLDESYIILSYSWLETYLSIVEEALYLHDPRSLGDNIQIKLGKILETESVTELVHDTVKKRLKEKSAWGLRSRIYDLKDLYGLKISQGADELDEISKVRNDLIHNKRIGDFEVTKGKITYTHRNKKQDKFVTEDYLDKTLNLTLDLFCEASKALNIDRRNKMYRKLEEASEGFRYVFKNSRVGAYAE